MQAIDSRTRAARRVVEHAIANTDAERVTIPIVAYIRRDASELRFQSRGPNAYPCVAKSREAMHADLDAILDAVAEAHEATT